MKKIPTKKLSPTFSERVVRLALSIPSGRVSTYGDIARACGPARNATHSVAGGGGQSNMAAMSVTSILARAYQNGEKGIPFHRIVYSDGRVWMSPEYEEKRLKLYKKEGIKLDEKGRIKDFPAKRLQF
jgi:alkylated DNA nucleotide flippase Atl1